MSAIDSTHHLVDVVIPAFNAASYINETLESVALQGDVVQSIIIVNDGSTDNTTQIIDAFSQKHPHLTVHLIHQ